MPDRKAKISTADPETAMTFELMQAMKRTYPGDVQMKRRAVLHVALKHMGHDVITNDNGVFLKLR